jgi:hypothetical protein
MIVVPSMNRVYNAARDVGSSSIYHVVYFDYTSSSSPTVTKLYTESSVLSCATSR